MKLKGGVIIIGSLIWEEHLVEKDADNIRKDWRKQNLMDNVTITKAPIRYGRESQTRKGTYTMIFSKSCEDNLGKGLILSFKDEIVTFEGLERQAIALAIAEGIYKAKNFKLTSNWGSVGLLINPKLKESDFSSEALIKKKWSEIYQSYGKSFVSDSYKINDEYTSPINKDGFLEINWQAEMDAFDILIATPVIPKPKILLNSEAIAKKMLDKDYQAYFLNNRQNNICTAMDDEIQQYLDTLG
jgi:hypothetical protein